MVEDDAGLREGAREIGELVDLRVEQPGIEGEAELNGRLSMAAIGGGITYYLMPINIYFSGSIGGAKLYLHDDDNDIDGDSDIGIAGDLTVGKEWWVGNSWGLGLAAVFGFHSIDSASGWNAGVRFSATFN